MKGYSSEIPENRALARLEGVNASYKDLAQVCGRIRNRKADWAISFLQKAAEGEIPIFYKAHNTKLGHRRELGGRKGRYPWKAAKVVLKVLQSAIANGKAGGMGDSYLIVGASANKKATFPRLASKGRQARSYLETSRVEIVLKGEDAPKGVSVTPPKKKGEEKKAAKKEAKKAAKKEEKAAPEKKEEPTVGKEEKPQIPAAEQPHEHKHGTEKVQVQETPHQHGEHNKG